MIRLLLLALLVIGGIGATAGYQLQQPLNIQQTFPLLVEPGDNLDRIVRRLEQAELLSAPTLLVRLYGRLTHQRGFIQAGEFELQPGMSSIDVLALLRSGQVVQRTVTFPEGWTVKEWLELLSRTPYLRDSDIPALQAALGQATDWEGRLFPDTYAYTRGETALMVLQRARVRMDQKLQAIWDARASGSELGSQEEALILASIIEKETGHEDDRALIASVFHNRLASNMRLQSDPTVIYGLEDFDGDLKRRHLRVPHAYNTYVIKGLPEGPICNPGLASLQAAVTPPPSPYYYFVAKGNGRSYFSTTLQEHNEAVTRFQKAGRVENYRSAPTADSDLSKGKE